MRAGIAVLLETDPGVFELLGDEFGVSRLLVRSSVTDGVSLTGFVKSTGSVDFFVGVDSIVNEFILKSMRIKFSESRIC